ncbi:hypothetical protein CLAIMM_00091 [Cladophialophora immunda]|nr:hypothetical protein CLAIMM_00091 [Cladophialophora immunda]
MALLAPYANDHRNPNGPADARPNALKIIRDQALDGALAGKVFFITGCTSGLGLETARAIHATGADIYFTGRETEKGREIRNALLRDGKPGKAEYIEMHLDSLESVRTAAAEFLKRSDKLNVLICNAGVRGYPKGKTKDGFELHFGINHLGHFVLFQALKALLISSSTPSSHSRVISLSASGHRQSGIRFDDFHFDRNEAEYQPLLAYAQSKTANILMAVEIERRYRAQGLHGLAVHPGGIANTGLNRLTPADVLTAQITQPQVQMRMKSAAQGAATTVWAAVARELEGTGGRFLEDCQESEPWDGDQTALAPGYAPHVYDREAASRLWSESLRMVGLPTEGADER